MAKKLRQSPRISVNKLGQYLTSQRPGKRRSILKGQKYPSDVVVARYRKVKSPIAKFLKDGNPSHIADAIAKISSEQAKTDWVASDNENTIAALEHFLELSNGLPFDDVGYVSVAKAKTITIEGVEVSVNPDFYIRGTIRKKPRMGAIKFHYIKGDDNALSRPAQEYVAMMCHEWIAKHGPKSYEPLNTLSMSIDVFRHRITPAPKATKQRMGDVEAGCSEIYSQWNTI